MKAHYVPACYLKGFAAVIEPKPRNSRLFFISRMDEGDRRIADLCVRTDYYTAVPQVDNRLFHAQESRLGALLHQALAGDQRGLRGLDEHLWTMKLRNLVVLDATRFRSEFLAVARTGSQLSRNAECAYISAPREALIASDDPLILIGEGDPANMAFILPVAPDLIIVSAPRGQFRLRSTQASAQDIEWLNRAQCRQARDYVLLRSRPSDPDWYRSRMAPSPQPAASGFAGNPASPRAQAILNFLSLNARGPDGLPSFLESA